MPPSNSRFGSTKRTDIGIKSAARNASRMTENSSTSSAMGPGRVAGASHDEFMDKYVRKAKDNGKVQIVNPQIREIMNGQRNVRIHVNKSKDIMVEGSAKTLPFLDEDSSGGVRANSIGNCMARKYWDVYRTDPVLGVGQLARNRALFANGFSVGFERQTSAGDTIVDEVPTEELHTYMRDIMTPFFRKVLRFLDCFGMCPFFFDWENGELVPLVPELGQFGMEMWLTTKGQVRYTFFNINAEEDEDQHSYFVDPEKQAHDIETMMGYEQDRNEESDDSDDEDMCGSDEDYDVREGDTTDHTGKVVDHTDMSFDRKTVGDKDDVDRDYAREARYKKQVRQNKLRAVSAELVAAAAEELLHANKLIGSGGVSSVGARKYAAGLPKQGKKSGKRYSVLNNMSKIDLTGADTMTEKLLRLHEQYKKIVSTCEVTDITGHVFIIFLEEPDYETATFNSMMSRLYNDTLDMQQFRQFEKNIAFELSRRVFGYEDVSSSKSGAAFNAQTDMASTAFAEADSQIPVSGREGVVLRTAMDSLRSGDLSAQDIANRVGARVGSIEDGVTDADFNSRRLTSMVQASAMISNLVNSGQLSMGGGGAATSNQSNTGRLIPGPNMKTVATTDPTVVVPDGKKIAAIPDVGGTVDFQKRLEFHVQQVALYMGLTGSALIESLSGSGLSKSGGSQMHADTIQMSMKQMSEFIGSIAQMIFRMMVQRSEGEKISLQRWSVPYDQVYVRVNGLLEPYDTYSGHGGSGNVKRGIHEAASSDAMRLLNRNKYLRSKSLPRMAWMSQANAAFDAPAEDVYEFDSDDARELIAEDYNYTVPHFRDLTPRAQELRKKRDVRREFTIVQANAKRRRVSGENEDLSRKRGAGERGDSDRPKKVSRRGPGDLHSRSATRKSKFFMPAGVAKFVNGRRGDSWGSNLSITLEPHNGVPIETLELLGKYNVMDPRKWHEMMLSRSGIHSRYVQHGNVRDHEKTGFVGQEGKIHQDQMDLEREKMELEREKMQLEVKKMEMEMKLKEREAKAKEKMEEKNAAFDMQCKQDEHKMKMAFTEQKNSVDLKLHEESGKLNLSAQKEMAKEAGNQKSTALDKDTAKKSDSSASKDGAKKSDAPVSKDKGLADKSKKK